MMKPANVRMIVVTVCLLGGAAYLAQASKAEVLPSRQSLALLPMAIGGWSGHRDADFTPEILAILGVDDYITRTYVRDRSPIGLYVGYHTSQRQGDTIHSPLNCIPGAGWQPVDVGRAVIPVKGAPGATDATTPVEVNRVLIAKGLDKQLVLYWYQSHRRVVAGEYQAKIYTVLDAVRYNRTDAALVRVIVPVDESDVLALDAERRGTAFVQELFPLLGPHLPN
jgi:EpsI family protein